MKIKKSYCFLLLLAGIVLFPLKGVWAASAWLSVSGDYVFTGDNVVVTVNYNAATWNLHLSGSINDSEVGYNPDGVNQGGSKSWNLNTGTPGTYTVSLSGDVTDGDTGNTTGVGGSVTVTVVERPAPTPDPTPTPTPTPTNPKEPVNPVTDGKSNNANLAKLTVDDYELTEIDETHFSVIVKNSITKITIQATPADSKATVSGIGEAPLAIGDNSFMILVQAENGTSKSYYLVVTRKDNQYTLERIDDALEDEDQEVFASIQTDDVISKQVIEKIKNAKKELHFVQNGEENSVLYTWVINDKVQNPVDFKSTIHFTFDDKDEFDELVGYRQGVYLNFPEKEYPKGVKAQIYVGDQYKDGDTISFYYYDKSHKKVILRNKELVVKNGMVEVDAESGELFLTKADILVADKKEFNPYIIVCIIEFIILCVFFVLVVYPRIRKCSASKEENVSVI